MPTTIFAQPGFYIISFIQALFVFITYSPANSHRLHNFLPSRIFQHLHTQPRSHNKYSLSLKLSVHSPTNKGEPRASLDPFLLILAGNTNSCHQVSSTTFTRNLRVTTNSLFRSNSPRIHPQTKKNQEHHYTITWSFSQVTQIPVYSSLPLPTHNVTCAPPIFSFIQHQLTPRKKHAVRRGPRAITRQTLSAQQTQVGVKHHSLIPPNWQH